MGVFSLDYFLPSAWMDYYSQPGSSSAAEEEDALFFDLDSANSLASSQDLKRTYAQLSSEDKKAHLMGALHARKQAFMLLESEKVVAQSDLKAIDHKLCELIRQRKTWEKRQKSLPDVIKKMAPQHVLIEKKLREISSSIKMVLNEKSSCLQHLQHLNSQIREAELILFKLESKIASMQ